MRGLGRQKSPSEGAGGPPGSSVQCQHVCLWGRGAQLWGLWGLQRAEHGCAVGSAKGLELLTEIWRTLVSRRAASWDVFGEGDIEAVEEWKIGAQSERRAPGGEPTIFIQAGREESRAGSQATGSLGRHFSFLGSVDE